MADEFGLEEKLNNILQKGHVAICGYNHSALYGNNEAEYGHVSIVVSLECTTHKVLLADPGPVGYGLKEVKIEDLFFAIKRAQDGVWDICKG